MPFCRTRLSAKRFIAGVGGYAAAPLPTAAPSKAGPPTAAAVLQLANDALGDIAHGVDRTDHLLLADHDIVEQAFKLRRHARIDQCRIGLFEDAEQRQAGLGRHDVLSLGHQKALFLKPTDDLGSRRRRTDALGFLQALPQNLIVNKPPGILHRLDQGAFVVARRWPGLLVLDFRIVQLRGLTVAQRRQQLRLVALFVGRLPLRECCAPAEIDRLTAGGAEFEATHVERCGGLPVAEVRHQGGQIGPRDDVEQFFSSDERRGQTSRSLSIVLTLGMTA